MTESPTPETVAEKFDHIDGMFAEQSVTKDEQVFVTITDEDAIGQFFRLCRELSVSRDDVRRTDCAPVMAGWLDIDE